MKLENTIAIVIIDGQFHPELSADQKDFSFDGDELKILTTIRQPIHLLFSATRDTKHTLNIDIAPQCHATIIEDHENSLAAVENKIKIVANKSSKINYYKLLHSDNNNSINSQLTIEQKENSNVTTFFFAKNFKSARETIQVNLAANNANYQAKGVMLLSDQQYLDYQTRIDHLVPNCSSNILFKGIVDNEATGNFIGRVVVHPKAIKSETHVTNKNLLLSPSATINTEPELEIYADDVNCTHGATVGQLDQDALFYLRARGIEAELARTLLIGAFTNEIIEQFIEPLKSKVNS